MNERLAGPATDLPATIGNPARNTLAAAGITRLDHLAERTEAETLALHGTGPKALGRLCDVVVARGPSFRDERSPA